MMTPCSWAEHDGMRPYHDEEWGVPLRYSARLFEMLTLEVAQAGLSWLIVPRRRDGYRPALAGFDPEVVADYTSGDVDRPVEDPGIIRHRGKIESVVSNAEPLLKVRKQGTALDEILWSFVGRNPVVGDWPINDHHPTCFRRDEFRAFSVG
jgi:DNA-3-methyladenine glycosylase I